MSGESEIALIRIIGDRTEYLVGRVDDLYDRVDAVIQTMVTQDSCTDCKTKWVPKSWAAPLVIAGGVLITGAGFAGDLLKVASWFGINR